MPNRSRTYTERLVQRTNELYFDLAKDSYQHDHPEIFEHELERWVRITKGYLPRHSPLTVTDIGSGTGFVPLAIGHLLSPGDTFACADISMGALDEAKRAIDRRGFHCRFRYIKIKTGIPYRLPFQSKSSDLVTMNSVLHHINDTGAFLGEVDRILRPGGLLFIAHEPNRRFYDNKFLWQNYQVLNSILKPTILASKILMMMGLYRPILGLYHAVCRKRETVPARVMVDGINHALLAEGLITKELSEEDLYRITDVKHWEGLDPERLLSGYEMKHLETYHHLYWASIKAGRLLELYDQALRRRFPKDGANFFTVFQKHE